MTIDDNLRFYIGNLIINNIALQTQNEQLQARIAELEKDTAGACTQPPPPEFKG